MLSATIMDSPQITEPSSLLTLPDEILLDILRILFVGPVIFDDRASAERTRYPINVLQVHSRLRDLGVPELRKSLHAFGIKYIGVLPCPEVCRPGVEPKVCPARAGADVCCSSHRSNVEFLRRYGDCFETVSISGDCQWSLPYSLKWFTNLKELHLSRPSLNAAVVGHTQTFDALQYPSTTFQLTKFPPAPEEGSILARRLLFVLLGNNGEDDFSRFYLASKSTKYHVIVDFKLAIITFGDPKQNLKPPIVSSELQVPHKIWVSHPSAL
jgi:hypothetical protein